MLFDGFEPVNTDTFARAKNGLSALFLVFGFYTFFLGFGLYVFSILVLC